MKFKQLYFSLLVFLFSACNVLDKEPIDIISDAQVWEDQDLVDANLTQLYHITNFNTIFNYQNNLNVITDEARTCFGWSSLLNTYTLGVINPDNIGDRTFVGYWEYNYVRQYNEFLEKITQSTTLPAEFIERRVAEVRFLRAFHYYNLVMRNGGVPIITKPQQRTDEDLYPQRNSEKEVYEFIRKELDDIIKVLPESYDAANKGRISKYTALALKSRAMLYAASIAQNGEIQLDGLLGVPTTDAKPRITNSFSSRKTIAR